MIRISLLLVFLLGSVASYANPTNSINSGDITLATIKAGLKMPSSCLRYKIPTRFCIWASPVGGRKLTPVLDHYLPDLVVVVYRNKDENPWTEARLMLDTPSASAQEIFLPHVGSGNYSFLNEHEQNIIFKEADVIGNPGLVVFSDRMRMLLLDSTATPMKPYFQSMLDSALWRGMMPAAAFEEASSVVLSQTHYLGKGLLTNWGGIYPHEGTVIGIDDAKASMVIAQRAADLLTNNQTFGHVHFSLPLLCGQHCESKSIQENSKDTLFQPVYPYEKDDCSELGSDESYSEKMLNEKGAYVWIVWRHYKGCPDGDGIFVGVTP